MSPNTLLNNSLPFINRVNYQFSSAKSAMQRITKFAKKAMWLGGLKALCQQRRRRLGYHKAHFSSAVPTPAGHLPVYVGEERQRFVIPTTFLSHPLFRYLLEKAHQEYGFKQSNMLTLPCNASVFKNVVSAIEKFHGQFDLEMLTEKHI